MFTFSVKSSEALARMERMKKDVEHALDIAAKAAAVPLVNRWKVLVRERAFRTGTYMRSIHAGEPEQETETRVNIIVGTDIQDPPYPFFLEFGTQRMEPRPTARPALEETMDQIAEEAATVFRLLLRRYGA